MAIELTRPEDATLMKLARSSRARARTAEGAAVRDADGRTYSAASVDLPSLRLSALQLAVAMAISSGATGLEAALVVTEALAVTEADANAVRDFAGAQVPIYRTDAAGSIADAVTT